MVNVLKSKSNWVNHKFVHLGVNKYRKAPR